MRRRKPRNNLRNKFYLHCLLSLSIFYAGFSVAEFYQLNIVSDAFAQRKSAGGGGARAGTSRASGRVIARSGGAVSGAAPAIVETAATAAPPPQPIVEEDDEDEEIVIPKSSGNSFALDKLRRERDELKRQVNTLETQKQMQKKSSSNSSDVAMCTTAGGRVKLNDLRAGVKSNEGRRDAVKASFADLEKEITELDTWIAENTTKRDELKTKAEGTRIAATATGATAIATGVGAGIMAMKNSELKEEERAAKAEARNSAPAGGGGMGGMDPSKIMGEQGGFNLDALKGAAGEAMKNGALEKIGGMMGR